MPSTNPFDEESQITIDGSNRNTNNPFEDWSHRGDESDNEGISFSSSGDDEDDDSFLSTKSESDSRSNLVFNPSSNSSLFRDDSSSMVDDTRNEVVEVMGKKRTAPLSFQFEDVEETPALNFHSSHTTQYDSESEPKPALNFNKLPSGGDHFASPLEFALIDQVDHLKSIDGSKNEEKKPMHENRLSYFSVSWLSKILYSPSNDKEDGYVVEGKGQGQGEKHELGLAQGLGLNEDGQKELYDHNMASKKKATSVQNVHFKERQTKKIGIDPLLEANDVKARMDILEQTVSQTIKSETEKKFSSCRSLDDRILTRINNHSKENGSVAPWTKLLILEDLGTASSWIILLLPYIAFFLSLLLDSDSLWKYTSDPLKTNQSCTFTNFTNVPLVPAPNNPCWYNYDLRRGEGLLSFVGDTQQNNTSFEQIMKTGVAITTGDITNVPPLSTYLYADINFDDLSAESVALVSKGQVYSSSVVMQKRHNGGQSIDNKWYPVSISQPSKLEIVCNREEEKLKWSCNSPRNVDILFTLPLTSALTGGPVRIDTIMSYEKEIPVEKASTLTNVISNMTKYIYPSNSSQVESTDESFINTNISDPNKILLELAQSSSYYVSHEKSVQTNILIAVRLGTLTTTFLFLLFWIWSIGFDGILGPKIGISKETKLSWFENPWLVFPERRFLLLIMIFLMMFQNPLLVYMFFQPGAYGSPLMHITADSLIGIGIYGILCLWLCLLDGLGYHTSKMAIKRAESKKRQLELQETIDFLQSEGHTTFSTDQIVSDNFLSYYDEYGNSYGSVTSWTNFRMKHDPCGDNWADFLLPKVCLFLIGATSVVTTAYFEFFDGSNIGIYSWTQYQNVYATCSLLQILVLVIWVVLVIRAALKTGKALRKEPFLSTRPAQLVFRILMSMFFLAAASFIIRFSVDVSWRLRNWEDNQHFINASGCKDNNEFQYRKSGSFACGSSSGVSMDILFRIAMHAKLRITYINTAASLGAGKILYETVCTLIIAFIFLPSRKDLNHRKMEKAESGELIGRENQRRDKRHVVSLGKNTHTWRVFPMPIDKERATLLQRQNLVDHFEVDKHLQLTSNKWGPGTIYENIYTPVFCIETALWLLECSWQTYYSATEFKADDFAPGMMNLRSVGLKLEADIFDEERDTRAFVATNLNPQVDGDVDSIIVVAFRGTVSHANLKTNFTSNHEPLSDSLMNGSNVPAEYQLMVRRTSDDLYGSCPIVNLIKSEDKTENKFERSNILLKATPITCQAFPRIHCGFQDAYLQIRGEIMNEVLKVFRRQLTKALQRCEYDTTLKIPKIYVTGHSLGGALSQLFALDLTTNVEICNLGVKSANHYGNQNHKRSNTSIPLSGFTQEEATPILGRKRSNSLSSNREKPIQNNDSTNFVHQMLSGITFDSNLQERSFRPPVAVYSFGQPRVGNHAFARFYKQNVPHTFRVVAEDDVITSLPLASGLSLYKHAGLEVALEKGCTGNILVGPTVVETMFRFSKVRTSLQAHLLDNYRNCIESSLSSSELQDVYRHRCTNDHSFRGSYNTSDILPDWVTHVSTTKNSAKSPVTLSNDWIGSNNDGGGTYGDDFQDWARIT